MDPYALILDYPVLVWVLSGLCLLGSAWIGKACSGKQQILEAETREYYRVIEAATLTLLGLIIGFTFSMALNRYDMRKNYEEAEANAIGTEFVRADLLSAADAAKLRLLLVKYVEHRIQYYETRRGPELDQINAQTPPLQAALWSAVQVPAVQQPNPVNALVIAGMNDVLNSQGYTQAARWNRIPLAAWILMLAIAIAANVQLGYGVGNTKSKSRLLLILPLVVSISFLLIADIDSPASGLIRVVPQNLVSLAQSLHAP
ncbi:MAG TPA: hypothetical protein VMB80_18275 [Candidatus Acidoferrum sp.]|nr:hypothetical protein [Candidatus Acidoferrum sp.]